MRLNLIAFVLFCGSFIHSYAQNTYRLETFSVQQGFVQASIENYPISIFLKKTRMSNYHMGSYAVEGWYYYNKYEKKIKLCGVYDAISGLVLYHFKDSSKHNDVAHFRKMTNNHFDDIRYYFNLAGYQEKFEFSSNQGKWFSSDKELAVYVNHEQLNVVKQSNFLVNQNNVFFDLNAFGATDKNYKIVASNRIAVILSYEYGPNPNVNGMCGAGVEKGFLYLRFKESMELDKVNNIKVESCTKSISNKKMETENEIIFNCKEYKGGKYEKFKVSLDLNRVQLSKTSL